MNSHDYILEKFTEAIYYLATGEGDARSRISTAYYRFWHVMEEDFPEHLRKNRADIDRLLTRLPGREGYIIPENIARMKNKTAAKIARLILEIYIELTEIHSRKNTRQMHSDGKKSAARTSL